MTDTQTSLQRQITSAEELQSVVRTMKALAASSIGQYEASVRALGDYFHAVELGLSLSVRQTGLTAKDSDADGKVDSHGVIIFGSDQGLVGQFNEIVLEKAMETLKIATGKTVIFAVGERISARLIDAGVTPVKLFQVPGSVQAIAMLIGQVQIEMDALRGESGFSSFYIIYNKPQEGAGYKAVSQRLLPFDRQWQDEVANLTWPSSNLPELVGEEGRLLRALIREYLFISLFRACAESLASENASRLAAMVRADRNIEYLLDQLHSKFHLVRQSQIDEELFDVIAGTDIFMKQR